MKKTILLILGILFSISVSAQTASDYNRSGIAKVRSGDYEGAIEDFEKALTMADVNAARVYHNIGISYEKQGNLTKAAENYDEAIRRNPAQIQSYERGGYVHYTLKNYSRAVEIGKQGMKLDPDNREIPRWLRKAYDESYKKERPKLFPDTGKLDHHPEKTLLIGFETCLIGAVNTDPFGFSIEGNPGLLVDVTSKTHIMYIHEKTWGGRIVFGNPYYGALLPDTLTFYERLEGFYTDGSYYIGGGLLGAHYSGKHHFGRNKDLNDIKLGFIYGFKGNKDRVDLYWYPRFIPSDTGYGKKYTMDVSLFDVKWIRAFNNNFDLYGAFSMNEFYYFDNNKSLSHYDGTYDFSGGCILNNRHDSLFTVYLYLTERMYMQNYQNEKPYRMLNGQGFFGLDTGNWFKGAPFSGIKTFGHVLQARFEHNFSKNFKLYEKISFEYCGTEETRHDITVWVGVEGGY